MGRPARGQLRLRPWPPISTTTATSTCCWSTFTPTSSCYRNNTDDNRWLQVDVQGSKSNRPGIGARLALYAVTNGSERCWGHARSSPRPATAAAVH